MYHAMMWPTDPHTRLGCSAGHRLFMKSLWSFKCPINTISKCILHICHWKFNINIIWFETQKNPTYLTVCPNLVGSRSPFDLTSSVLIPWCIGYGACIAISRLAVWILAELLHFLYFVFYYFILFYLVILFMFI